MENFIIDLNYIKTCNLKEQSVYKLAVLLNTLISLESTSINDEIKVEIAYQWDRIVYELWERIPSLKNDATIKPKTLGKRRQIVNSK